MFNSFPIYILLLVKPSPLTICSNFCQRAIKLSDCFHEKGHDAKCEVSGTLYTVIFGIMEIALSQLPNLEKISLLSYIAAAMSVTYSLIGLCLCLVEFSSHPELRGTLFGVEIGSRHITLSTKIWHSFQALGNIAFAYTFAMLLIEIQVTKLIFVYVAQYAYIWIILCCLWSAWIKQIPSLTDPINKKTQIKSYIRYLNWRFGAFDEKTL